MTYKEKLMKEKPAYVGDDYLGGCSSCPGIYWVGAPMQHLTCCNGASEENCSKCWNTEIPGTKPTTDISNVDIHKIIDDAMEKKDRSVVIFIGESGVNVNVTPLENTKPRWIDKDTTYVCSECGSLNKWPSPFCPLCGEKLAIPVKEGED